MKRIVFFLIALVGVCVVSVAQRGQSAGNAPDFAYPSKVKAQASRELESALKSGDGSAVVNALVRIGLAESAVSADSLPLVLSEVEAVRMAEKDAVTRSMLGLLEAQIYCEIFSSDRWTIEQRDVVDTPEVAGNYNLWGRKQFLDKVEKLVDEAMSDTDALRSTSLDEYKGTIIYEREALTLYPTMLDFAAYRAIDCLERFDNNSSLFSMSSLSDPMDEALYPSASGGVGRSIMCLYRKLMAGREDSAPGINARVNAMKYISDRIFRFEKPVFAFRSAGDTGNGAIQAAFLDAYRKFKENPWSVEFLLDMPWLNVSSEVAKDVYGELTAFEQSYPTFMNIEGVRQLAATLGAGSVNVDMPVQVAKGGKLKARVSVRNLNSVRLSLYRVPDSKISLTSTSYRGALGDALQTVEVKISGEVPFAGSGEAEFTVPEYGKYVLVPELDGMGRQNRSYDLITCSDLAPGYMSGLGGESYAVVRNAIDGAPAEGVKVSITPWDKADATRNLVGSTDADGFLKLDPRYDGGIYMMRGADKFANALSVYHMSDRETGKRVYGSFVTSLGVYRPGDTMEYSAVLYEVDKDGSRLCTGKTFTVVLRDANYQEVARESLTTDAWGRACGSFEIPSDGLTGYFSLGIAEDNVQGRGSFMVSDYKLPTFEVKARIAVRPATLGDDAVVDGSAVTYSGFPVEDATVKMQLKVRTGAWWFASVSPVFYETEVKTGAGGEFSITVPGNVLETSPFAQGYFMADISVTSPDGETHEANIGFNMGKPAYISADLPAQFNASSPSEAMVKVLDVDGKPLDEEVAYKISRITHDNTGTSFSDAVKEGVMKAGDFGAVLASLPSGMYGVIFSTPDTSVADPTSVAEVTVWRPSDTSCASDRMLWLPETSLVADGSGRAQVVVGSNVPGSHMLMVLSDDSGKILSSRWIQLKGMQTLDVQLPSGVHELTGLVSVVSGCSLESARFSVKEAASRRKIEVAVTTFRDKVTPGDMETLTLSVKGVDGADAESAVLLDMSSKAIDALCTNRFAFNVAQRYGVSPVMRYPRFGSDRVSMSVPVGSFSPLNIGSPVFELYGRSFVGGGMLPRGIRIRGNSLAKSAKLADTEESAVVYEADTVSYAAGSVNFAAQLTASADNGIMEEAADEPGAGTPSDVEYRPSEVPLAFFRPMLSTDPDGNLEVTYTVPDANTTWILRALAYNKELQTATDNVDIVASKPVMVSTNPTRFLRCGDKVCLQASVMNATDSISVIHTVSELLNVSDNRMVAISESLDTIAPMGRSVVSLEYEVPADMQGLVFRVKAASGRFTDGEQVLIPVLPSEQNVVESTNFYLAPGENSFHMALPSVGNGRAYLKYTGNPAWEVVSALPGLREGDIASSLSAAGQLYSAAVADGLMRRYPEIARTIRKWADNPADSALTSMLSKNSQLKDMLLNSTPWVSDALSQTERMERLVLLLDSRNTSRAIKQAVAELRKNFTGGQGWSWTPQYGEYSEWCTLQILDILGGLNRMGWLPDNQSLRQMVEDAVKNIDRATAQAFSKNKKGDFTAYCYMRMKYPDIKLSTAATTVVNSQVRRIISGWKDHQVVSKAVDALVLNANGYSATARQILESLTEYATYTKERGMWWAQLDDRYSMWSMNKVGLTGIILDAYSTVTPSAPEVDRIRQWLVLNKADNSWGNAIATTQVISSLLTSGSDWTVVPESTAIRVNGTLLEPSEEYATGAFTEAITPMVSQGGELVIDRQGNYPSFGGVLTMRVLPMGDVKGEGTDGLDVAKYMSVYRDGRWIPASRFAIGDRVKVTLTLEVGKDMSYVVINDKRAAGLEPAEQLPAPVYSEGLCFYRENRDSQTNMFINFLPKGTYMLEYELFATQAGEFASGVAQVQSQYNPLNTAHSGGALIEIVRQ